MAWLRGICRFEFSFRNDELNFEIGWLWIVLIAAAFWVLVA
jgi:hypothetical protein